MSHACRCFALVLVACSARLAIAAEPAELILHHGRVLTVDAKMSEA